MPYTIESYFKNVLGKEPLDLKQENNVTSAQKEIKEDFKQKYQKVVTEIKKLSDNQNHLPGYNDLQTSKFKPQDLASIGSDINSIEKYIKEKILGESLSAEVNTSVEQNNKLAIYNDTINALKEWYFCLLNTGVNQDIDINKNDPEEVPLLEPESPLQQIKEDNDDEKFRNKVFGDYYKRHPKEQVEDYLENNAKKLQDGLYIREQKNGKKLYVITNWSEQNIKRAMQEIRSNGGTEYRWTNVPSNKQKYIEDLCIKEGKRCFFNGVESEASKTMTKNQEAQTNNQNNQNDQQPRPEPQEQQEQQEQQSAQNNQQIQRWITQPRGEQHPQQQERSKDDMDIPHQQNEEAVRPSKEAPN